MWLIRFNALNQRAGLFLPFEFILLLAGLRKSKTVAGQKQMDACFAGGFDQAL